MGAGDPADQLVGESLMRKYILGLAVVLAAAAPALAAKKSTKHHRARPAPTQAANPNANAWHLLRDALPVFLPSVTLPIYMKMKADAAKREKAKHRHKKKMK
jgi:hypothetical protein